MRIEITQYIGSAVKNITPPEALRPVSKLYRCQTVLRSIPVPISVYAAMAENSCCGLRNMLSKKMVPRGDTRLISSTGHCRLRACPQSLKCAPVHSLCSLRERLKQVAAA